MEDKDKRKGWLRELNVGDEVAVNCGAYGLDEYYEIDKISRITPTGRMTVKGVIYDPMGIEKGYNSFMSRRNQLFPITQEIRNSIRKLDICSKLEEVKWHDIDLDKLNKIVEILGIKNF